MNDWRTAEALLTSQDSAQSGDREKVAATKSTFILGKQEKVVTVQLRGRFGAKGTLRRTESVVQLMFSQQAGPSMQALEPHMEPVEKLPEPGNEYHIERRR